MIDPSISRRLQVKFLPADSNFLGIEEQPFFEYAAARFVVFAAPYEHTSSYHRGSAQGPAAMLRASQFVELYDEELDDEPFRSSGGIATVPAIDFAGAVDKQAVELIRQRSDQILADGKIPVMLGAEHTVTLGAVRAAKQRFPDLCVLQIDAHSDLRIQYQNNRYSHASVMARVHELGVPIIQVGIRAQCREEAELIRSAPSIHTLYAHQIRSLGSAAWIAQVAARLTKHVYVTIDADGFDPSVVPAVGTAEPNGLSWTEVTALLDRVSQAAQVVGFDAVEIAPQENSTVSEYVMAKLVYKLMGFVTRGIRSRKSSESAAE